MNMNKSMGITPLDALLLNSLRLRHLIDELNERGRAKAKEPKAA
jgi:hypothetical protein